MKLVVHNLLPGHVSWTDIEIRVAHYIKMECTMNNL